MNVIKMRGKAVEIVNKNLFKISVKEMGKKES